MNMICKLDGNALCITREDFVNLQEDKAMFIELTSEQIVELNKLDPKLCDKCNKAVIEHTIKPEYVCCDCK